MSKVRVDQLSPTDDSKTINVSEIATTQDIDNLIDDLEGNSEFQYDHIPANDISAINTRATNRIKVAHFNIWGAQALSKWGVNGFGLRNKAIQEAVLRMQVDLMGTSETLQNAGLPISLMAIPPLNNSAFSISSDVTFRAPPSDFNKGEGFISSGTLISTTSVKFPNSTAFPSDDSNGQFSYLRSVVSVRSVRVAVYTTHLNSSNSTIRAEQIQFLSNAAIADIESKVIVMGDMNTPTYHEFDYILSNGFSAVNLDDINTRNDGVPTNVWYYDQILYRGFSTLISKGAIDVDYLKLSDHKPIYAELEV